MSPLAPRDNEALTDEAPASGLVQVLARSEQTKGKTLRSFGVAFSLAVHVLLALALVAARKDPPKPLDPAPITVALVDVRTLEPASTPPSPATAARAPAVKPPPPQARARQTPPPPPNIPTLAADPKPKQSPAEGLSDGQLAGAASADSGPAGGPCDMARWLQGALRKDPLVQGAVAASAGKAIMVWNGDWIQSSGENGKGLAAVREAIMWEIAFAPKACRAEPVHGMILLSMNGAPGAPRLAMGSGDWRWSDLLSIKAQASRD